MLKNYSIYPACGECPFFKNEDSDGNGWCQIRNLPNSCDAWCYFIQGDNDINEKQAERILHYHQKWRRYNGKKHMRMVSGTLLGRALDIAIRVMRKNIKKTNKRC